jgi:hopene-associated glycosyltransferase HpnB
VIVHVLAAVPLLIWIYLRWLHGGFWRVSTSLAPSAPPDAGSSAAARVVAVIPARDEADVIGDTVCSLLQQQGAGHLHVIVVDDASTDGTARAAEAAAGAMGAAAQLTVLAGQPLPAGWTGKLWAMSQGVAAAVAYQPDFLLLTDADIHHDPGNLASLLAMARSRSSDLVSFMVRLSTATLAEKALIPAFVFFFFMLYPPRATASRRSPTAGAAGGCMLIRPQALARIGGLQSIRSELIDDCALALAIKRSGGAVQLALTRTADSTRRYGSFGEVGGMISRSAFYQLKHSWVLLAGTLAGLGVMFVLPPLLVLSPDPLCRALGAAAWLLMAACYWPLVRFYQRSLLWSLALPLLAAFYAGATLHSALQYLTRRGGSWKGRVQDVRH